MQLEQMKKDRDAAEQKNAEQLKKIRKNFQNRDDDETTRSKLSVDFETTTSEVVLQKQQLSVQNEPMNMVKQGDTEQEMSDKEADEKDKDVEVCVRQVMQMPQVDRRYWVKLLLPLMTQRHRDNDKDRDNDNCHKQSNIGGQRQLCNSQRATTERIQISPKKISIKIHGC